MIAYFSTHLPALFLLIYIIIINITVFVLCAADKYRAKRGMWRVRERTFFTLSIVGGSPLMLAGMYLFRHKTKHREFTICVPMILALQIVLVIYLQCKYSLLSVLFL